MKTFIAQKESLEADPIMLLRQLIVNIEAKKDATSDEEILEISNQIRQLVELLPSGYINNNIDGRCPIHLAVYQSDYETIELLSSHGANFNFLDDLGNAPLFYALNNRDSRATGLLLRNGASKEFLGEGQPKPLFITIDKEDLENTELLLDKGANPNLLDFEGNSAFYYAYFNKDNKLVELLLKYSVKEEEKASELSEFCRDIDPRTVESFLDKYGTNKNLEKAVANRLLYEACCKHDYEKMELLLGQHNKARCKASY